MTKEAEVKAEKVQSPYAFIEEAKDDEPVKFRLDIEGDVVQDHWVDRRKAEGTSAGFKFIIKRTRGLYFIKNIDYGWQEQKAVKDDGGNVYDVVHSARQGFDFDNQPYGTVEAAMKDAIAWLREREKERAEA